MQNGLSHVRKMVRLLSAETIQQITDELSAVRSNAQTQLEAQSDPNSTLAKLLQERIQYTKDMEELVGKIQFEKLD